ncbi:MAG: hypothetical protein CMM92_00845 [Rickettsiales bacterium]|nr:hypothetical protein [Rickettsiales bacterium]RPG15994.1 MAG: hypothetical protein CBD55_000850 [Pelagibacteraceae bacterium TMED195]|tara:strand:- start:205 stop:795 length:591 start_codon:yes stop_codon:yes gene_type:complete
MGINKVKNIFLFLILFASFEAYSKTTNVLKLSCEYDPKLIKKQTTNIDSSESNKLDRVQICKSLYCKDTVEVHKDNKPSDEAEYRLRNSWFNHQGILLDDFLITENTISINTFVSQAYFLESYLIDRITGKTKRTFYRFDNPDFFSNIKELEKSATSDSPLFNEKGKLSLKTIKSFSLEPWEIFYFEGKCLEGVGL